MGLIQSYGRLETTEAILPDDTSSIDKPTITAPANNTSFYTSTAGIGGWYVSCQGSLPNTLGDAVFADSGGRLQQV